VKFIFCLLLVIKSSHAVDEKKIKNLKDQVSNEKTHAGPMGMGLTKSYQINDQIVCIYNTINGQVQITLKSKNKCPQKRPVTKN
tara:strand:+ start:461 stop:712 length:252 start_codon:yes stop_codon:yes gene_type:complete